MYGASQRRAGARQQRARHLDERVRAAGGLARAPWRRPAAGARGHGARAARRCREPATAEIPPPAAGGGAGNGHAGGQDAAAGQQQRPRPDARRGQRDHDHAWLREGDAEGALATRYFTLTAPRGAHAGAILSAKNGYMGG